MCTYFTIYVHLNDKVSAHTFSRGQSFRPYHAFSMVLRKLATVVPGSDHYWLGDNLKIKATLNLGESFEGQVLLTLKHF